MHNKRSPITSLAFRPVPRSFFGWTLFGLCYAMLLPSAAHAACARWDISGEWPAVQTNDAKPTFALQQTGTQIQGSGRWAYTITYNTFPARGDDYVETDASVDGTINGDTVEFTAYWSNNTIGVYSGKIGPQGRIQGTTYDKLHPETKANWYSGRTVKCLDGDTSAENISPSTTTPHTDAQPPPVVLGRVHVSTPSAPERMGNESMICAQARSARARNSPIASDLETKCQEAGGSFTDRAATQGPSNIRTRNAIALSHTGIVAPPPAAVPTADVPAPQAPDDRPMQAESFAPPLFDDGARLWACDNGEQDVLNGAACRGRKVGKAFCRMKGHSGKLQPRRDGKPSVTVSVSPVQGGILARAANGDVCTADDCAVVSALDCAP